jgi:hypothetical protein
MRSVLSLIVVAVALLSTSDAANIVHRIRRMKERHDQRLEAGVFGSLRHSTRAQLQMELDAIEKLIAETGTGTGGVDDSLKALQAVNRNMDNIVKSIGEFHKTQPQNGNLEYIHSGTASWMYNIRAGHLSDVDLHLHGMLSANVVVKSKDGVPVVEVDAWDPCKDNPGKAWAKAMETFSGRKGGDNKYTNLVPFKNAFVVPLTVLKYEYTALLADAVRQKKPGKTESDTFTMGKLAGVDDIKVGF